MSLNHEPIEIKEIDVGLRLDKFLKIKFKNLNYLNIQKLIRTGQIRINGKRVDGSKRLELGNKVRVPYIHRKDSNSKYLVFQSLNEFWKDFIKNNIIYKDKDILAINKPCGMAVQGGTKITNHLDDKLDFFRFDSPYRPQLLHRLDKDTSGVLVLSRNPDTTKRLGFAFKNRTIKKIYWAIIIGHLPKTKGSINLPLAQTKNKNFEMTSHIPDGKESITGYTVLWKGRYKKIKISLVEFNPETGRKHQIRAHCYSLGCNILGDKKYKLVNDKAKLLDKYMDQMHLHAKEISIPDIEDETTRIISPIPIHMKNFLKELNLYNYIEG